MNSYNRGNMARKSLPSYRKWLDYVNISFV